MDSVPVTVAVTGIILEITSSKKRNWPEKWLFHREAPVKLIHVDSHRQGQAEWKILRMVTILGTHVLIRGFNMNVNIKIMIWKLH
jgi:hypothetical protein